MSKTDFIKINIALQKQAERKQKQLEGGTKKFEKGEWMKLSFGDTVFMVLPPANENADLYNEVYVHHNFVDPVNPDRKRSYLCSQKVHGSCPICKRSNEMKAAGDTKGASEIKGQRTFLYNVMDSDGNVKVAPMKPSMHTEVLQEINTNYIDNDIDVTDPANGKLIKLSRLKAAPWARARVIGKSLEMSENKVAEVLSKLKDLTKVYINNTPEELERVLAGEEVNFKVKNATEAEITEGSETLAETVESTPEVKSTDIKQSAPIVQTESDALNKAIAKKKAETAAAKVAEVKVTAPVAKAAPVATPKVEAKESTGDDELDAMLSDLDLD